MATVALTREAPARAQREDDDAPLDFVQLLLEEQQQTTAVERFAQRHASVDEPLLAAQYRDLIPLSRPEPGEQYAFEVDLDACSGCKSCVVACHNLNGLEGGEPWRKVGLLHGAGDDGAFLQHVTTACHHCVDPACLSGCPVMAYEKDEQTGIVRHLDDQCIGCQYCVFTCPYDVPHYNAERGIVRKCDMCRDRLAADEAPACVQSCPNKAIRIRTVAVDELTRQSETHQLLPAAPASGITLPTTVYKSAKPLPQSLLPADYFSANRQHSHLALVVMLVLTQLSAGAFVAGHALVSGPWANAQMLSTIRPAHAVAGLVVALVGMNAAVFHLGRPRYAFRALLGLRTSWLSREILAFGLFAALAAAHAVAVWMASDAPRMIPLANATGFITAACGLAATFCSVMIYAATHRPYWSPHRTGPKFFLTAAILGLPLALFVSLAACAGIPDLTTASIMQDYGQSLCRWLMAATAAKLLLEASILAHLNSRQTTPLRRTAIVLTGELGMTHTLRYFFGIMGGLILPMVLLSDKATIAGGGYQSLFVGLVVALMALLLLIGEMLERYLFFAASIAPKMPGAPCT